MNYRMSKPFLDAVANAGGPIVWSRRHQCIPRVIAQYCHGTRKLQENTLRLIYAENVSYWNKQGIYSWRDLAA